MNFGYKHQFAWKLELAYHLHLLFFNAGRSITTGTSSVDIRHHFYKTCSFCWFSASFFAEGCGNVKWLWFAFECSVKQGKVPLKITKRQNDPCWFCQKTLLSLQSNICLSYQCHLVSMSNISSSLLLDSTLISKVCRVTYLSDSCLRCDVETSIFSVALLSSEGIRTWIVNRLKAVSYGVFAKLTMMKQQRKCHYFNSSWKWVTHPVAESMLKWIWSVVNSNHMMCKLFIEEPGVKPRCEGKEVGKMTWKGSSCSP